MRKRAGKKTYRALYGQIAIDKAFCGGCNTHSLVLEGRLACCDTLVCRMPEFVKREVCPEQARRLPSITDRKECLEQQDNRCFYCDKQFGSRVFRGTQSRILRVEWDHIVPWSHTQDNRLINFVAACQICNNLKSSTLYPDVAVAKIDLEHKRAVAGWT